MEKKKEVGEFEKHFRALEILSQELQDNKVPIDDLVPRMKEALVALKVCKKVLQETKSQLTEMNKEFEDISNTNTQ